MLDRHKAGPLGNAWNRRLRPEHQHPKIPATFVDAMKVRTAVYVDELGAPQVHEFHFDDWHAFHWVMYISERRVIEPELRDFITGQLLRTCSPLFPLYSAIGLGPEREAERDRR